MRGIVGAAAVAGGLLALYLLLGQSTYYRTDGLQLVFYYLERHAWVHRDHPLYLQVAGPFVEALRGTGLGAHRLATVFSALCTSVAALIVWAHARYAGLSYTATFRWVLLVGLCPAVLLFATVVEFHAFFLPFAALAFLVAEVLLRHDGRRGLLIAAVLGVATFVASLAHGTGNLLVPLMGAWVMGRSEPGQRRRRFGLLCAFAAVHVVLLLVARPWLLHLLGDRADAGLADWLEKWFKADGWPWRVVHVAVWETLVPFFPVSLLVAASFHRGRWQRGWAVAGFLPYAALCVLVLADPVLPEPMWERGSYLLPLVIPAGWIAVHAFDRVRPSLWYGFLLAACVASIAFAVQHDTRPGRHWGKDARAVLDDRPTILWAGLTELPWATIEAPRVRVLTPADAMQVAMVNFTAWSATTRSVVDDHLRGGGRVLFSRHARADLEHLAVRAVGAPMWAFFEQHWQLRPLRSGSFEGWELLARS